MLATTPRAVAWSSIDASADVLGSRPSTVAGRRSRIPRLPCHAEFHRRRPGCTLPCSATITSEFVDTVLGILRKDSYPARRKAVVLPIRRSPCCRSDVATSAAFAIDTDPVCPPVAGLKTGDVRPLRLRPVWVDVVLICVTTMTSLLSEARYEALKSAHQRELLRTCWAGIEVDDAGSHPHP